MSADNTFAIAYKYHALGRCVIPSGGGAGGKSALVRWKEYQTTVPTDEDIERWNSELKLEIWAMLTGKVSGVFVVDADMKATDDDIPDYPTNCCQCGCGERWLRQVGSWGPAEWLCSRCYPESAKVN